MMMTSLLDIVSLMPEDCNSVLLSSLFSVQREIKYTAPCDTDSGRQAWRGQTAAGQKIKDNPRAFMRARGVNLHPV
jgi:hypothetical protein